TPSSITEQYDTGGIPTAPLFGRDLKKCMELKRVYLQLQLLILQAINIEAGLLIEVYVKLLFDILRAALSIVLLFFICCGFDIVK
ncbi:TPA: hypothetical protein ACIVXL_003975, partial [Salmonella enterica subsp. houtenae serovar 1,40:z4,z23:-]